MSEMPVLIMPPKPNFMVVDGKTYLVDQIELSPQDMLGSVEQFYKDQLEEMKEQVTCHVSAESQADLNAQVTRIERHLARGVIALPDGMRENGTLMYLNANRVYPTRIVLFKPTRISVVMQRVAEFVRWIDQDISRRDAERFTKFCDWARPLVQHYRTLNQDMSMVKVDIFINQDLVIEPMVCSFIAEEEQIYVAPARKHPHVHVDGHLCTGNTPVRTFWDDAGFVSNFNSLNPHSWANNGSECAEQHKMMLKNQYFLEAYVRTEEVSAWRV